MDGIGIEGVLERQMEYVNYCIPRPYERPILSKNKVNLRGIEKVLKWYRFASSNRL